MRRSTVVQDSGGGPRRFSDAFSGDDAGILFLIVFQKLYLLLLCHWRCSNVSCPSSLSCLVVVGVPPIGRRTRCIDSTPPEKVNNIKQIRAKTPRLWRIFICRRFAGDQTIPKGQKKKGKGQSPEAQSHRTLCAYARPTSPTTITQNPSEGSNTRATPGEITINLCARGRLVVPPDVYVPNIALGEENHDDSIQYHTHVYTHYSYSYSDSSSPIVERPCEVNPDGSAYAKTQWSSRLGLGYHDWRSDGDALI